MTDAYDPMRRISQDYEQKIKDKRWIATGIVTDVRLLDKKIRVSILPEQIKTGWMQVYYNAVGANYVTGQIPEVNSEVVCLFIEGHLDGCLILQGGFLHEDDTFDKLQDAAALPISDKFGNKIILDTNGITITSSKDLIVNVAGAAKINVTGECDINAQLIKMQGGSMPVARVGDQVQTPAGPGVIVAGNNTFLA